MASALSVSLDMLDLLADLSLLASNPCAPRAVCLPSISLLAARLRNSAPILPSASASACAFASALRAAAFSPISLRACAPLPRLAAGVPTFPSASAFAATRLRTARAWYAALIFSCASSSSSIFFWAAFRGLNLSTLSVLSTRETRLSTPAGCAAATAFATAALISASSSDAATSCALRIAPPLIGDTPRDGGGA